MKYIFDDGELTLFGYVLLIVVFLVLGIFYSVYQFNLCYPDVSDSFWYCLQHAL